MELGAFLALAVLAIVRIPALARGGASRASWMAVATGAGALFMVGVIVPLEVIDAWMGGSNFVNLVQNVLATVAVWCVAQAVTLLDEGTPPPHAKTELLVTLCAFSIPFFLMDRGSTSTSFVESNADDPLLWAYASVYMAGIAFMTVRVAARLRGRMARAYMLVRIGLFAMAAASALQIAYLTLRVLGREAVGIVYVLGELFIPLFYGGIAVVAAGLAWFPAARIVREAALRVLKLALERLNASRGLGLDVVDHYASTHDVYRLAVRLSDLGNREKLRWREAMVLRVATSILDLQVKAPAVIRLAGAPGEVAQAWKQ